MYNKQSWAQHAHAHGRRNHPFMQSQFRAPVNVYKTENSYELLVFAPGRIKENFSVKAQGSELTISYTPPEGFPRPEWIKREYSRGGFQRVFTIDETVDTTNIKANYTDGVLQLSLPIIPGKETPQQDIPVN